MDIFFLPKEAVLLEFKRVDGSGWLTKLYFIRREHRPKIHMKQSKNYAEFHKQGVYFFKKRSDKS